MPITPGTSRYGLFVALCTLPSLAVGGCVPHRSVTPGDDGPDPAEVIESREVSVSAQDGVVFAVRGAELTVPAGSLEYDAIVEMSLAEPSAVPDGVALPDGRRALVVVWIYTDVRVAGRWPFEFQIFSDFEDPDPYDPDLQIHTLDPRTNTLQLVEDAVITRTYIGARVLPGYLVVTVPMATPQAIGLTGAQTVGHIVFPSTVMSGVDNAFGIRSTGTDLQRYTNSIAPAFRDRPYISANGYRLAIVRECLDGSVPDRIYATTPSSPLEHLTRIATGEAGTTIGDLCFRPDGDSVVAAGLLVGSGSYGGGVFMLPVVGDTKPRLLYRDPGPGLPRSVAISPDGASLALTTARFFPSASAASNYDVIVVSYDGPVDRAEGDLTRVTAPLHAVSGAPGARVEAVSFSPDGSTVYFGAYVADQWRIYGAAIDGSSLWEVEGLRGYRWAAVSPDATQMVVGRNDRLYTYTAGTGQILPLGPPANGFGYGLLSRGTTKISWRGR